LLEFVGQLLQLGIFSYQKIAKLKKDEKKFNSNQQEKEKKSFKKDKVLNLAQSVHLV